MTAVTLMIGVAAGLGVLMGSRGASAQTYDPNAMVITLTGNDADCAIGDGETLDLPFGLDGERDLVIDWGDGTVEPATPADGWINHIYSGHSARTITITGTAHTFGHVGGPHRLAGCFRSVEQWGNLGLTDLSGAFEDATSLVSVPATLPNGVTDLHDIFHGATSFNGDIGRWNTRHVTSLAEAFLGASSFNGAIGSWDVSQVTSLNSVFRDATSFDQGLNAWSVNNVTDFARAFEGATSFDHSIERWSPVKGTTFAAMFRGATSYDKYWWNFDPQQANDLSWMYAGATSYDQRTLLWDPWYAPNPATTAHMFDGATSFDSEVTGTFNNVTDASHMFEGAISFNQPWANDSQSVVNAEAMFKGATSFNSAIDGRLFRLSNATSMFEGATALVDPGTSSWGIWNLTATGSMFRGASKFDGNVQNLAMQSVTDASRMFEGAVSFTGAGVASWNTGSLQNIDRIFYGASSFDANLGSWNTNVLTYAPSAFREAKRFGITGNSGLGYWTVTNLLVANSMFHDAVSFGDDISGWDVRFLRNAENMFTGALSFDRSLARWIPAQLIAGDGIGFANSGLSAAHYSELLRSWQGVPFDAITIDATGLRYTASVASARAYIEGNGVTILDDGTVPTGSSDALKLHLDFTAAANDGSLASNANQVTIQLPLDGIVGVSVDWGDGSVETIGDGTLPQHTYTINLALRPRPSLTYDVKVTGGVSTFTTDALSSPTINRFLTRVDSFGNVGLVSLHDAFSGLNALAAVPSSLPATVRDLSGVARGNSALSPTVFDGMSTWDVSGVIDMSSAFAGTLATLPALPWNTSSVRTMASMFNSAIDMGAVDVSNWDVANVSDMTSMFEWSSFNGALTNWHTSSLRSMRAMFNGAQSFDQPVAQLDVSKVTNLESVFRDATVFDQPVAGWDTSKVTDMRWTFSATALDRSLASWNFANLLYGEGFIDGTPMSTANYDALLGSLAAQSTHTSVVLGVNGLHYSPTGATPHYAMAQRGWDLRGDALDTSIPIAPGAPLQLVFDPTTSACGTQSIMLAMSENHGISVSWGDGTSDDYTWGGWPNHEYADAEPHTISITGSLDHWGYPDRVETGSPCITQILSFGELGISSLAGAFQGFNHLTAVPTSIPSTVRSLSYAFAHTVAITADISTWNTGSVTDLSLLLFDSDFDPAIGSWDTHSVTNMVGAFRQARHFNHPIGGWDVSHVTSLERVFSDAPVFDQDLSGWNTRSVASLRDTFNSAVAFNHPIGNWNTSKVTEMAGAFVYASSFDQSLAGWDVSHVGNMFMLFANATAFNGDITTWDTSSLTTSNGMFAGAVKFNQPIGNWIVSSVEDATNMFSGAASFNQDVSRWRFNSARGTEAIFYNATSFNSSLAGWRFPATTNLNWMFFGATSFNGDVSNWDVPYVSWMMGMFQNARSFNRDLSSWNMPNVVFTNGMFNGASSFDQDLSNWKMPSMQSAADMLTGTGLTVRHFTDTIIGWNQQVNVAHTMMANVSFSAPDKRHYATANAAIDALRSAGWSFNDAGDYDLTPMVIEWDPATTECTASTIELAFGGYADGTIDWGDGTTDPVTIAHPMTHTYTDTDSHMISVAGEFRAFGDGAVHPGGECVPAVDQWGGVTFTAMPGAFRGWTNLTAVPTNSPGTVTDFSNTFRDARSFRGDVYWNFQSTTTTAHMFDGAAKFNGNTDYWSFPSLTDASYMFAGATRFNRYVGNFGLANATTISHMFAGAASFGGDLNSWNVAKVTDFSHAFDGASSLGAIPDNWNPIAAVDMTDAFKGTAWTTFDYERFLNAISSRTLRSDVPLGVGPITYRASAAGAAHGHLVNDLHWTVTDGGPQGTGALTIVVDTNRSDCDPHVDLPLNGVYDADIDWGDGSALEHRYLGWDNPGHDFVSASGTHRVAITGLAIHYGAGNNFRGNNCIIAVESFGDLGLTDLAGALAFQPNLTVAPTTLPSTVRNISNIARESTNFNGDIGGWDTSHVTSMEGAFWGAAAFRRDLSGWNVANVTSLDRVFFGASSFDSDLSTWNTSNVTSMSQTFTGALAFTGDISTWDVSKVTNMLEMFRTAVLFNGDISRWDTSKVATMQSMFSDARAFNADISGWNTSSIAGYGFYDMFAGASSFNRSLASWNVSAVTNLNDFLTGTGMRPGIYTSTLQGWAANPATATGVVLKAYGVYGDSATDAARTQLTEVNHWTIYDYGTWQLDPMTITYSPTSTSCGSSTVEFALSGWVETSIDWGDGVVEPVTTQGSVRHTYADATERTIAISGQVDVFGDGATHPGGPCFTSVTSWGHLGLRGLPGAFRGWSSLTTVPNSSPGTLTDLSNTFRDAVKFNADLDYLGVDLVKDFSHSFDGARSYARCPSWWSPASATNFDSMFRGATSFNCDLGHWSPFTGAVTSMAHMFEGATSYNVTIASWDVHSVTSMSHMFDGATSFDQPLNDLRPLALTDATGMLDGSGIGAYNYSRLLEVWSQLDLHHDVTLGASGLAYRTAAVSSRDHLTTDLGWTIVGDSAFGSRSFELTIDTGANYCGGAVTLPLSGVHDITIDWNDGGELEHRTEGQDWPRRVYEQNSGRYTITITGLADYYGSQWGTEGIYCHVGMSSFGDLGLKSVAGAFGVAYNLTSAPAELPSTVRDISGTFFNAAAFNGDISGWDTSRVTRMVQTFYGASVFTGDLSRWDTHNVTDMTEMFRLAPYFNSDISGWDTSKVLYMSSMFHTAQSFNADIRGWNVSNVRSMNYMFNSAWAFNQEIGGWDVRKVVDMNHMFYDAVSFNGDISGWQISSMADGNLDAMFRGAVSFNHSLGSWDISRMTRLYEFLFGAGMKARTYGDTLVGWLAQPNVPSNIRFHGDGMYLMPEGIAARDALIADHGWDISDWGGWDMTPMLVTYDATSDVCSSHTTSLTLSGYVDAYIQWNDGSPVQHVITAGTVTHSFDDSILMSAINISGQVERLGDGQAHAGVDCYTSVDAWGHLDVRSFAGAFRGWSNLRTVPAWLNSTVVDFTDTFRDAVRFNSDINPWDVRSAKSFANMFNGATAFDRDISGWSPQNAETMTGMFRGATSFSGRIGWPTYSLKDTSWMFAGATRFGAPGTGGDIYGWDVSHVTTMAHMFDGASSFNQSLQSWRPYALLDATAMMTGTPWSTVNYSTTLQDWSGLTLQHGVVFDAGTAKFRGSVSFARQAIIDNYGWHFIDGDMGGSRPLMLTVDMSLSVNDGYFTLPVNCVNDLRIDWGDYTPADELGLNQNFPTHRYEGTGTYQIAAYGYAGCYGGTNVTGANTVTSFDSFGDIELSNLDSAFSGMTNLTAVPAELPSTAVNLSRMFNGATWFNGDISGWDTSHVTSMSSMFNEATTFNGDISAWNVGRVTNMEFMFSRASAFDKDLRNWDVSNVTSMTYMFSEAYVFDGDISTWDVSHVTDMSNMFRYAHRFNSDISGWNVAGVTRMNWMFFDTRVFNADLSSWNVTGVVSDGFQGVFSYAVAFDHSLANWDIRNVANLDAMLDASGLHSRTYSETLEGWAADPGTLNDLRLGAAGLTYLSTSQPARDALVAKGWSITDSGAWDMSPMQVEYRPTTTNCGTTTVEFALSGFTDLSIDWGDGSTPEAHRSSGLVSHTFDGSVDSSTIAISGQLGGFGDGEVHPGGSCFTAVTAWGHLGLRSLAGAFRDWTNLLTVDSTSPGQITDLSNTFRGATKFSSDLNWDVSATVTMAHMFDGATSFNGNVESWFPAYTEDMSWMFHGATSINRRIGDWNVGSVRTTAHMFDGATSIAFDNGNWNLLNLVDATSMFEGATSFNSNVAAWSFEHLGTTAHMFDGARSFNRSLGAWNVTTVTDMTGMLDGTDLSVWNYGQTLQGWSAQSVHAGVHLGASGRAYRDADVDARTNLIADHEWTIDDAQATYGGMPMVIQIDTSLPSCDPYVQLQLGNIHVATINWGDGATTELTDGSSLPSHDYSGYGPGAFSITVEGLADTFGGWYFRGMHCFKSVDSFGELDLRSIDNAFVGMANLVAAPSTLPASIRSMTGLFRDAFQFNSDISAWDTSHITSLASVFERAVAFNSDISGWNVSNVTDMNHTFASAGSFTSDLSRWNTSKVVDMSYAFYNAVKFDSDLSGWDVANVTNMSTMFYGAAKFNGDISGWNTAKLVGMDQMLTYATSFDHSLAAWDIDHLLVSPNEALSYTGMHARTLSRTLTGWAARSGVPNGFNLNITSMYLDHSGVVARQRLVDEHGWWIGGSEWSMDPMTMVIDPIGTACATDTVELAFGGYVGVDIDWGDGSAVESVDGAGVRSHTYASAVRRTIRVSGQLASFGDGQVHAGGDCFTAVGSFGHLALTGLPGAFRGWTNLASVPASIGSWVTDMSRTFQDVKHLTNVSLASWETANVTTMAHMFDGATNFNGSVDWWNVTNLKDSSYMFAGARAFNGGVGSWYPFDPTSASHMFDGATSFNVDLSSWRVPHLEDASSMFAGATSFNGRVDTWTTTALVNASSMFAGASKFNADLRSWSIANVTDMSHMLDGSAMSAYLYGHLLMEWSGSVSTPSGVTLGASGVHHRADAEAAKADLTTRLGWTIDDAGTLASSPMHLVIDTTVDYCNPAVSLPLLGVYSVDIDWGDGNTGTFTGDNPGHVFGYGRYDVTIGGDAARFGSPGWTGIGCVTSVDSWGSLGLVSLESAFHGTNNLVAVPSDFPETVVDTSYMFSNANIFDDEIGTWDVSNVRTMTGMFRGANYFNRDIGNWDVSNVTNMDSMFDSTVRFQGDLTGWNVGNVTSMRTMFQGSLYDQPIGSWNVSNVIDMTGMFTNQRSFDQDLSGWNLRSLRFATSMFANSNYDRPLDAWRTPALEMADYMFSYDADFDQPLSHWDTRSLRNADRMFQNATAFDQPIDTWDVRQLRTAVGMFQSAVSFDRSMAGWHADQLVDASAMFNASAMNSSVAGLIGPSVRNISWMFSVASRFDQPLDTWDVSGVTTAQWVFDRSPFNHPLSSWDTRSLVDAQNMFENSVFDQDIDSWNTGSLMYASRMFANSSFDRAIPNWDLPNLQVADGVFEGSSMSMTNYSKSLIGWGNEASNLHPLTVTSFSSPSLHYRSSAAAARQNLIDNGWSISDGGLDTPNAMKIDVDLSTCPAREFTLPVQNVIEPVLVGWGDGVSTNYEAGTLPTHAYTDSGIHRISISGGFGQFGGMGSWPGVQCVTSLADWGDTLVTDLTGAFFGASNLRTVLMAPPTSVTNLEQTFAFTGNLSIEPTDWDVSHVRNFTDTFNGAKLTGADLSLWNTSSATTMARMFQETVGFDSDISGWDVSHVTSFAGMFQYSHSFNRDISRWNTSSAVDMSHMFDDATMFNQQVSNWDVSHVTNFDSMFRGATAFDRSLSGWTFGSGASFRDGFLCGNVSRTNWSNTIDAWSANSSMPNGLTVDVCGLKYAKASSASHTTLTTTKGWTLTNDGGQYMTVPATPARPTVTMRSQGATIQWVTPFDGDSAITAITVTVKNAAGATVATCSPTLLTGTSCAVTGLVNGTVHTVSVTATNSVGTSAASPTASFTPIGVPDAPAAPTVTGASTKATVVWVAPFNGGAAIDSYKVEAKLAGVTKGSCTTNSTPSAAAPTTCQITGLVNGTSYSFTVVAHNTKGDSPASPATIRSAGTPPATPTGLTATAGAASIVAKWTASPAVVPAVSSYTAIAYAGATEAARCTTANGTTLTCTITGLTNGTAYTVKVMANSPAASSALSAATAAVTPLDKPGAPTAIVTERGHTETRVSWTAPASNGGAFIDKYTVSTYKGTALQSTLTCSTTGTAAAAAPTTCLVKGLTDGQAYTFKVIAHNTKGDSPLSVASAAVTPAAVPATMPAPTAAQLARGDGTLKVSWIAPATNGFAISKYTVSIVKADGTPTTGIVCPVISGTATNVTCTGIGNTTAYKVKVRATNSKGDAIWSDPTTLAAATVPGAPTAPKATSGAVNSKKITFSWTAPTNTGGLPITGYDVFQGATKVCSTPPVTAPAVPATSCTTGTLPTKGTFNYTIVAKNALGSGAASVVVAGKVQ